MKKFKTSLKRHKYRKNIIKELIDTEELYVKSLETLRDEIMKKLPGIISD